MHVGFDVRLTAYRTGGISTYMRQLAAAFEAVAPTAHITMFAHVKERAPVSTHFRRAWLFTPCHHRFERSALAVELWPHRLDVFHSPDFIPPRAGARRYVITVPDLAFLHTPEILTRSSRRTYNDQIGAAVRHADAILAISKATRDDLVTLLGVPPAKIVVQHLGAGTAFRPQPPQHVAQVRAALGLPPTYLLAVGTLEPRKNLGMLLDAYALLRAQTTAPPPLVLVGRQGWLADALVARVQSAPGVRWLSAVDNDALPAIYSGAAALLLPSLYEGFGLSALEAMACGTVPLVSHISSLPEVVGDVGLRLPAQDPQAWADALAQVLNDDAWRAAQQDAALAQAAQFTWERAAQVAWDVYTAVHEGRLVCAS